MDEMTRFEARFEERLRAFARTGVQSVDSAEVARAVAVNHPRSAANPPTARQLGGEVYRRRQWAVVGPWRTRSMFKPSLAAAAVVVVLASGVLLMTRPEQPAIDNPSPSLPGVVAPSSTPSATAPTASGFPRSTGVWIATGSMGTPRYGHDAMRLLDGRVLVMGSFYGDGAPLGLVENDTSAELYDPDSGTWSATGNMLKPRGGFSATMLRDGRVLVLGGANGDENDTSAELYDPVSGTWSATGNMLKPQGGFGATLLRDGRVLVGDGDDPNADDRARWNLGAEVYDPASGTWTATGKMITPRGERATLLRDGTVLVTGIDGAQLYDPDSGTWTATGRMHQRYGTNHAAVLLSDGKVLVAGGYVFDQFGIVQASAELYDPATGTWTEIANMNAVRPGIDATLLPDGRVLVMGGSPGNSTTPDLYDPAAGTWTATGNMVTGSPTLLLDGRVLVVVGGAPDSPEELFDQGTGSWTTTGPMLREHRAAPATLLLDGTVLVAGGFDCSGADCVATGTAELYVPAGVTPPSGLPTSPPPTPTPTPVPIPTAIPTPFPPETGPVPPGARSWPVTVVNGSSQPATLFVAEELELGVMGRLVGSVSPNVVPPRTTVEVTFLLPAKGVEGWGIFLTPIPGISAFLWGTEVPLTGEIRIGADGSAGWRSIP